MADEKSNGQEGDFEGGDLFDVLGLRAEDLSPPKLRKGKAMLPCSSAAWRLIPTASRMLPPRSSPPVPNVVQSSTPVNIPDWSKTYNHAVGRGGVQVSRHPKVYDPFDEDEGGDGGMIPPHEFIARRLERTRISSHSMCEGIGGTLKGRDLSLIRNAILTKTGFLE
ncbi:hypothetical protein NMG60_11009822 [Bertholletia excelsa]